MSTITHTFTAAGAWSDTAPAGTISATIALNGGGGNGGAWSSKSGSGGGGGGGGYCFFSITSLAAGATLSGNI